MLPRGSKGPEDLDLPDCNTLMEVHGFLGVCGIVRIWVKDFTKRARPLVILTKKEMDFVWGPEQRAYMEDLKQVIVTAPCLRLIDYRSDHVLSWWLTPPALP